LRAPSDPAAGPGFAIICFLLRMQVICAASVLLSVPRF